jgi:hypothetical protein
LFFLSGSGVCTQDMVFASQMFYPMRHTKSHFLICFSDVISILHRLAGDNDPSSCAYNVAGIIVTPTKRSLFGVLLTFLTEPASNHDSSISASWIARFTSISCHACHKSQSFRSNLRRKNLEVHRQWHSDNCDETSQ